MPPSHGLLGATFTSARILQSLSTIPIIGLTANFLAQAISSNQPAPQLFIGVLSIACITLLYTSMSLLLYSDNTLPFLLPTAVGDILLLIAFIVIAVVLGQPLTYLNCLAIGNPSAAAGGSVYEFTAALGTTTASLSQTGAGERFDLATWADSSLQTCAQIKGVWGLGIGLCVLFAFSGVCMLALWRRGSVGKDVAKGGEV